LSAALACVALALLAGAWLKRLRSREPPPLAGPWLAGLCLGLAPALWDGATEAKGWIYTLVLLQSLGLAAWVMAPRVGRRALAALGLLLGLGLAHHYLGLLPVLAPVLALLLWRLRGAKAADLGWAVLLLLCGISLYLALLLRAPYQPALDLPRLRGGSDLWALVARRDLNSGLFSTLGVWDQGRDFLRRVLDQVSWPALLLAGLGLAWAWRRGARAMAAFIAAGLGLTLLAVARFMPLMPHMRFLGPYFSLPGLALLLLAAAAGYQRFCLALPRLRAAFFVFALLGLGCAAILRFPAQDRSADFAAYDFGRNLCLSLPPRALYLARSDFFYMPLHYLQGVEGRRPDCVTAQTGLLGGSMGLENLARRCPGLRPPLALGGQALLLAQLGRPGLCIGPEDLARGRAWPAGMGSLCQQGLLLKVMPHPALGRSLSQAMVLRPGSLQRAAYEPPVAALLQWQDLAKRAFKAGPVLDTIQL
jgi:MFS family permease